MTPLARPPVPRNSLRRIESQEERSEWDRFVEDAGDSTYCHWVGWKEVVEETLGHECLHLIARDQEGRLTGVLPLVDVNARPLGRFLISMPFLNAGGPLGSGRAQADLVARAVQEARSRKARLLELRTRSLMETDPGLGMHLSERRITVVLPLPSEVDALWSEVLPSKVRSQIRRPMKEGMEARFGPAQMEPFYEVFSRHMRDLGTPVLPRDFFERIRSAFGGAVEFGVVYGEGRPVAAGCGFVWKDTFEITWASALREFNRSAPNMLLYWAFMERMVQRGIPRFDFGRCSPGSGTHRFKRQWKGEEMPLPWLGWSAKGVSAPPGSGSRLLRLAAGAWRRLPLPIANRVGPLLARRLP